MKLAPALAPVLAAAALAPAALASSAPSQLEQQWELAGNPAVKIAVRRDGWYHVARKSLLAAGLSRTAPAKSLRLFADGRQVPIRVDRGGSIEFFGQRRSIATTDTRIYWLVSGSEPGLRIAKSKRTLRKGRLAGTFGSAVVVRPRNVYYAWLKGGPSDLFFGPLITPAKSATQSVVVPSIDPRNRPLLDVAVQGFSLRPHQVSVAFNGTKVASATFEKRAVGHAVARLPAGAVMAGENSVTVSSNGGELDFVMLWKISVTYSRTFVAGGDRLVFRLPRAHRARVTGFTSPNVRLFNITDPFDPQTMPATVRKDGDGYALMVPASSRARRFLAFGPGAVLEPASVVAERPSRWHNADQGADMIVISHEDFIPSLAPLVALRESQGLRVKVVDVRDVYDEFSYGVPGPEAIRAFLARAYLTWRPRPLFVLLVGDASFDPKNYLGLGMRDYVPTRMIEVPATHVPSDDALADLDNDGVPEMAVGRLPVQTTAGADAVVRKIVSYDRQPPPAGRPALFVADSDPAIDIEGTANQLQSFLPASMAVTRTYRADSASRDAFKATVMTELDSGPGIVDYIGHGGPEVWGHEAFLGTPDPATLTNGNRLSLYLMTSCLNAWFLDPKTDSLGEAFLEAPNGGAIAVLSSSGLETADDGLQINGAILRALFAQGSPTIGEAEIAAKRAVGGGDLTRATILFGDPASRLR